MMDHILKHENELTHRIIEGTIEGKTEIENVQELYLSNK
jgi:hypothetical protein